VNFIGLHNDEISGLWAAFAPASHYDGVKPWPYPNSSAAEATARLKRVGTRPVFVAAECTLATNTTMRYLNGTGVDLSNFTVRGTGFIDHNSFWALRPDPMGTRRALRQWVGRVLSVDMDVDVDVETHTGGIDNTSL
jgi:hypothetical protein